MKNNKYILGVINQLKKAIQYYENELKKIDENNSELLTYYSNLIPKFESQIKLWENIKVMDLKTYLEQYGEAYENGELFDYPLNELDYIINDTDIDVRNIVLINDRLYEIN